MFIKIKRMRNHGVEYEEKDLQKLPEIYRILEIPEVLKADTSSYRYSVKDEDLKFTTSESGVPYCDVSHIFMFNIANYNDKENFMLLENNKWKGFGLINEYPYIGDYIQFHGDREPRITIAGYNSNYPIPKPPLAPYPNNELMYTVGVNFRFEVKNDSGTYVTVDSSFQGAPFFGASNNLWENVEKPVTQTGYEGYACGVCLMAAPEGTNYKNIDDMLKYINNGKNKIVVKALYRYVGGVSKDSLSRGAQNNIQGSPGIGELFSYPFANLIKTESGDVLMDRNDSLIYQYMLPGDTWGTINTEHGYNVLWKGGSNYIGNADFNLRTSSPNKTEEIKWFFEGIESITTPTDTGHGPNSTPGGGGGNFDDSSDAIDVPSLPGVSGLSTGFVSAYNPSPSQLSELSSKMWTTDFFDQIVKLWNSPMEGIVSLQITFAPITSSGNEEMKIGNYNSKITVPRVSQQFVQLDCGSINLKEYWGNFLDYAPNTELSIYLPFIGTRRLDVNNVMDGSLNVVYNIDVLTGVCVANLMIKKNGLSSVIYSFAGNCNVQIPFSSSSWGPAYNTMLSLLSGVNQGFTNVVQGGVSAATGRETGVGTLMAGVEQLSPTSTALNMANALTKPMSSVATNGSLGSASGALSVKYPYLILNRPIQSLAKSYASESGFPSNITSKLSALNGYTKVLNIHLDGVKATETEKDELLSLLRAGVIL